MCTRWPHMKNIYALNQSKVRSVLEWTSNIAILELWAFVSMFKNSDKNIMHCEPIWLLNIKHVHNLSAHRSMTKWTTSFIIKRMGCDTNTLNKVIAIWYTTVVKLAIITIPKTACSSWWQLIQISSYIYFQIFIFISQHNFCKICTCIAQHEIQYLTWLLKENKWIIQTYSFGSF